MKKKVKIVCFCVLTILCYSSCFPQINYDSILWANSEKWTGHQNKESFAFGKPSFGPYTTLTVSRIDAPVIKNKTKEQTNSSLESSGGRTTFDQTKSVLQNKTTWYSLSLGNGTDTTKAVFAVTVTTRKQKKTFLGSLFGKPEKDDNRDDYYDNYKYTRNIKGTIRSDSDTSYWTFFLSDYVNKRPQGGYIKNEQDSMLVVTQNANGFSTEIVVHDLYDNHLASVFFNSNDIKIYILRELSGDCQRAIAVLFAVIVSIKK